MKSPREQYHDIERVIEFDFVRATEHAALNSIHWLGRGEKELADAAACDAIRGMFDLMDVCCEVVIGEGIKDNAPGIFKGEHLGTWTPGAPKFDLALDPIDGTTNIAKGAPNSIACIAAASPEDGVKYSLKDIPSFYMMKIAYGPEVVRHMGRTGVRSVNLRNPVEENIIAVSQALRKRVQDVVVLVMDRPRHAKLIEEIRATGAALRMISDGDLAAALAPSVLDSGVDHVLGVVGPPEAVYATASEVKQLMKENIPVNGGEVPSEAEKTRPRNNPEGLRPAKPQQPHRGIPQGKPAQGSKPAHAGKPAHPGKPRQAANEGARPPHRVSRRPKSDRAA